MSGARPRLRWLSIAEVVALIGVVIAGLTLWNSWVDRRDARAAQAAAEGQSVKAAGRVDLVGAPRKGGKELLLRDPRHDLQDVTIAFPAALGVTAQRPLADPVIVAEPLRDALLAGNDLHAGRVPVLVTTRFVDGDDARTVSTVYDLIWTTDKPLIGARSLRLDALRLHQRHGSQAALDAIWAKTKPAPKK
jgi:hypothetical protein